MKVFIGSSVESLIKAEDIATYIEGIGLVPQIWNDGVFVPSEYTFESLEQTLRTVDAAIFIFNEDDKQWYRGDIVSSVRDNILIEYGMFCGALGRKNVVFCCNGQPKIASDLNGITFIDLNKTYNAKSDIRNWLNSIQKKNKSLYDLGVDCCNKSQFEQALKYFNRAVELEPENAAIYAYRAYAYLNTKKYVETIEDCNKAEELNPYANYFLYSNRGYAYYSMGKLDRAIEDYDIAISHLPKDSITYFVRGQAYEALGKKGEALADYCKAMEYNSEYTKAYTARDSVISIKNPFDRSAYLNRANIYFDSKIHDTEYIMDLLFANFLMPSNPSAYYSLAEKLTIRGEYDKALYIAKDTVARFPKDGNSYGTLAYVLCNQGCYEESVEYCDKAIELKKNRWFYNTRGRCYLALNQLDKAEKDFMEAINIDPSYIPAKENLLIAHNRKSTQND